MTEHVLPIETVVDDELQPLDHAVSVVIPAFNEAAHVAEQVASVERIMRTSGWRYEVIVIDDGSTDGTAEAASRGGLGRIVRRRQNRGYGAALKLGVRLANYDWVLITDADGTYPVEAIPALLAEADVNTMVVGSRTGAVVRVPLVRRPAKWFLNRLASYLAGRHLPDINSGLRLMRKSLINRYEHLLPDGFSFTTTITLSAACNAHPLTYVPIDYHARLATVYGEEAAPEKVVRERRAVVALRPVDRAEALYQLALALRDAGQRPEARTQVIRALEAAPSFERAQQLLLELSGSGGT